MDATTRWETEALREGDRPRPSPPKPTKATRKAPTNWVTLKEAEAATGIPVNTLRKWVRKSALPSYLESDGDIALRMVDLDAVKRRARELGRTIEIQTTELGQEPSTVEQPSGVGHQPSASEKTTDIGQRTTDQPSVIPESPAWEPESDAGQRTTDSGPTPPTTDGEAADATMMVPVDAWNKMLAQLGNLHEAGQQLAEARERAAKAETEAVFLRERLAEMRTPDLKPAQDEPFAKPQDSDPAPAQEATPAPVVEPDRTTTYWRYLTTGWRDRRRRGTD
ncbi:MAG: hypothetical protein ACR2NG_08240 [Acidimicrobiia bacterium]